MPESPSEVSASFERLRQHLEAAFADQLGTVSAAEKAPVPTLLLQTKNELAAFAISNGNPQQCYDLAYPYFKDLYAERHVMWDTLNLSFVLCLARRQPEVDQLCTTLETDVYFCRKFVVFLDQPIARELARLPFVPLERSDSAFQRPPSAQTLLNNYNVPPRLAHAIVAQHIRSAEGIVQDGLSQKWGEPKLSSGPPATEGSARRTLPKTVRLDAVEIENFRAYRKKQTFDLSGDLVVLYGPNGFGKTSFFDAVDFGATAEIGRLHIPDSQRERFLKAARHLDCGSEPSTVTLTFRKSNKLRKLVRVIKEHELNEVILDGTSTNRKAALVALTGSNAGAGVDRIENMIRLFRATHLFSQEFQDLTESFRLKSELPSDVVSRMLAFEDYVQAGKKLGEVCDVLRARILERNDQVEQKTAKLNQDRTALAEIQQRAGTLENPDVVTAMARDVCLKVQAAGIDAVELEKPSVSEARGWRAIIESKIAETKVTAERLASLVSNAPYIAVLRAQVSAARAEIAQKSATETDAVRDLFEQQNTLNRLVSELAELKERETTLHAHASALNWQGRFRPQYDQLRQTQTALEDAIISLNQIIAAQKAQVDKLASDVQGAEEKLNQTQEDLTENKQLLESVQALPAQHALWAQQVRRHRELAQNAAKANEQINDWQSELIVATADLNEQRLVEQRAADDLAQHQQAQSGLQNLLTEIESYITSGTCPVCGENHGSPENLLGKLHTQRGVGATVDEAAARLQQARERSTSAAVRVEEIQTRIRQTQEAVTSAEVEAARIATEIANFENRARSIVAEPIDPQFAAHVSVKRDSLTRKIEELSATIPELHRTADELRAALQAARTILTDRERELTTSTQNRSNTQDEIMKLQAEAQRIQVSLDSATTQDEQTVKEQLFNLAIQLAGKEEQSAAQRITVSTANQQVESLRQAMEHLQNSLVEPQRAIEKYEADLRILTRIEDSDAERLTALSQEHLRRISAWEDLKQTVINLEVVLDTSATSALMAETKERIRSAEEELRALTTTREQTWLTYFERLRELLEDVQDRAVSSYTQHFGPQASIIQQRLRSVFGFENIELNAAGSSIEVRVIRNGEPLRPPDYFSQSQQQILMLSLFLTACMTQTWSEFAPIFLDDPVTHFDDLNTYAFLDLIGGLLETSLSGHQVVISTCEERLFQIARQKFAPLGKRAKLYRFVSLSNEGPIIEEV